MQAGVTAYLPWLSMRTLPTSTHIAMLVSMLGVMLYRHAEYSGEKARGTIEAARRCFASDETPGLTVRPKE